MFAFKSGQAFLEYLNVFGFEKVTKGIARPALVPENGYLGIENHVHNTPDGRYSVGLIESGPPNGFCTIAETSHAGGAQIKHGDVLMWEPFKSAPIIGRGVLGKVSGDKRSSWIDFIVGKVAPEIDNGGRFPVLERYNAT